MWGSENLLEEYVGDGDPVFTHWRTLDVTGALSTTDSSYVQLQGGEGAGGTWNSPGEGAQVRSVAAIDGCGGVTMGGVDL